MIRSGEDVTIIEITGHIVVTNEPAKVLLKDTISGFKGILEGEYDHLPEQAFYMVGSIDEALEKAKK